MKKVALNLTILLLAHCLCMGQTVLFNTGSSIYAIEDGTCNYTDLNLTIPSCTSCKPFTIARFKDTLYIMTFPGLGLFWMNLKSPGIAQPLPNAPPFLLTNNLTCDKDGLLYYVGGASILSRFNPHTGKVEDLGTVPYPPAGDMTFYNDKLLIASANGIYSLDVNHPADEELLIGSMGYTFYGLVTLPSSCNKNKLYGMGYLPGVYSSVLVGIDPDTKSFTGETCDLPNGVLDAASLVEDGTTYGVDIDSIFLQSPCENELTGSAHIFATGASKNPLSYTLDGLTTNTTGVFETLSLGSHTVHITTQEGCSNDSTFTLTPGLSPVFDLRSADPLSCYQLNGSIDIRVSTGTPPLLFMLDNAPFQTDPHFGNLDKGDYTIRVIDGGHCEKDLTVTLKYQTEAVLLDHVTMTPTVCTAVSGSLVITPAANVNPQTIQILLNDLPQPGLSFPGLDAGSYKLSLVSSTTCRFDTTIRITAISNDEPAIQAFIKDPLCSPDDGSLSLSINGLSGPYKTSLNGSNPSDDPAYPGLTGGSWRLSTIDKDGCSWDTTLTVRPFHKDIISITVDSVNPNCRVANSGSVHLQVEGSKQPYVLLHNNITYANGSTISGLNPGNLSFLIINSEGCIVDSIITSLQLELTPECDSFYMPNAFTPNGDGHNDLFRPLHSPYLRNYLLVVYNRWGQMVYSSHDYINGWDGTANGQPLPPGTYAWAVEYENFERQKRSLRGVVVLIR